MGCELVLFRNDDGSEEYGIMMDDNTILCLCCYGVVEEDEYEIIKNLGSVNISEIIKENY